MKYGRAWENQDVHPPKTRAETSGTVGIQARSVREITGHRKLDVASAWYEIYWLVSV